MFAVFKTGGKQYKVEVGDILSVERLAGEVGKKISFPEVLMISESKNSKVGTPFIKGAAVTAMVIKHTRAEKILVFKKIRRHNSRKLNGHKQPITLLKIEEINTKAKITENNKNSDSKTQKKNKAKSIKTVPEKSSKSIRTKTETQKASAKENKAIENTNKNKK